jgi:transcriptional regulator with XRE-family HTH domain
MRDLPFGAALRSMRIRRGWRQEDVAAAARVSPSTVSRMERGQLDSLSLRSIRAGAAALEVMVELLPRSRGAAFERAASQAHAALAERVVAWITSVDGWVVRPEVSFSRFGERGVIDILAWHAATRSLLVIELKTEIVDVGELLGTLDRKLRNGMEVAIGLGWSAMSVSGLLVVAESDVNRRRVAEHRATFQASFPDRIIGLRAWLAAPVGTIRALMFFANRHPRTANDRLTAVRRVRKGSKPAVRRGRGSIHA